MPERAAVANVRPSPPARALRVCALYPDLMNIHADRGNLLIQMANRTEWVGAALVMLPSLTRFAHCRGKQQHRQ